jgi:fibronectin type 3 domain-containing protein
MNLGAYAQESGKSGLLSRGKPINPLVPLSWLAVLTGLLFIACPWPGPDPVREEVAAPIELTARADGSSIIVSWLPGADIPDFYKIHRSTSPDGSYTVIGSSSTSPYTDTGLSEGTYYYRVSAVTSNGESPLSQYYKISLGKTDEPKPSENNTSAANDPWVWGEWIRMDTGETWYISNKFIKINGTYATTSISFTQESDRVAQVTQGGRIYYLFASRIATATVTGTVVIDGTAASAYARAAGGGREVVLTNQNNESVVSATTDTNGVFEAGGIIAGDTYRVTVDGKSSLITPNADGDNLGTFTVTDGLNFKIKIGPSEGQEMPLLYADGSSTWLSLTIENTGTEDCTAATYDISYDSGLQVSIDADRVLGTIEPGKSKTLPISVRCSSLEAASAFKKINLTLTDTIAKKQWHDSVSIKFHKATMVFSIQSNTGISGVVITPNDKAYPFTHSGTSTATTLTLPSSTEDYLVVFSGATAETEARYSFGINTEPDTNWASFIDTGNYEPNNTESTATSISASKIMSYLHKNDIDYYRIPYNESILPPAVPSQVSANVLTDGSVMVSWQPVPGASSYQVYRSTTPSSGYSAVGTATTSPYTDTLTPAGTYYYKISAVNSNGTSTQSVPSSAITTTVPAAPGTVSAGATGKEITISWSSVSGASSYEIYRSITSSGGSLVGTAAASPYTDTVQGAGTYYYTIRTVNYAGKSASSSYRSVTIAAPSAPGNVSATAAGVTVTVSWQTVSGASSYKVYRSTSSLGTYREVGTVTAPPYTDTLTSAGTYYYQVRGVNSIGEGPLSSYTSVTIAAPSAPGTVLASLSATGTITVSWQAVSGASSYKVYRSTSPSSWYNLKASLEGTSYTDTTSLVLDTTYYYTVSGVNPIGEGLQSAYTSVVYAVPQAPSNVVASITNRNDVTVSWQIGSGGSVSSYKIYRATNPSGPYSAVGTATASPYTDEDLSVGTYYYQVSAVNVLGESYYSSSTAVTISLPAAPSYVWANVTNTNEVMVAWYTVADADSYTVYRATASSGPYSAVGTVTGASYTDTLTVAGTYYYTIRSVNILGEGPDSSIVSVSLAPPPGPSSLSVALLSDTSLRVSWQAVSGASSYRVYRATSYDGNYTPLDTVTTLSYRVTGLSPYTTYYFKVASIDSLGEGTLSNVVSGTTASSMDSLETMWADTYLTSSDEVKMYYFDVSNGTSYFIRWKDSSNDAGKSAVIDVTAFYQESEAAIVLNNGIFTASTTGRVIIKVTSSYAYSTGTYAIACGEN